MCAGHYRAVDDIYPCPLRQAAVDTLNRQLRSGIAESETLAQLLHRAVDDIYRYPLRQAAVDTLNRQLRSGMTTAFASYTRKTNTRNPRLSAQWA